MGDLVHPEIHRAAEARTALAVTTSGTGVWDRDVPSGSILYSVEWKAMLGYAEHEITDRIEDSYTRVHPDDLAGVQAAISDHFENRTPSYAVEHRLRCKDGRYIWVLSRGKVVSRDADGKAIRMTGVTTDITQTVALSEQLRQGAELLKNLTDEIPGLVYQYRLDGEGRGSYTYASAGMSAMFGVSAAMATLNASLVEERIHPDDVDRYRAALAASAATLGRMHVEFRVNLPGLGDCWRGADAKPRRLPDGGVLWHGFVSDITEHKLLEQRLHDTAATDFLTGLPNRRHLVERMEQELARIQREPGATVAVLMFDLDHFKAINDVHGHATGDEVLKHSAALLRQELRRVDSIGRIGGEEFAIILAGANMMEAGIFAERVRARLASTPMLLNGLRIDVTVSVGVAAMQPGDTCVAASLSRADTALYEAKQSGRDRVQMAA